MDAPPMAGPKGEKNLTGVVLAGGLGTRMYPLTKVTNKHLLPIYNMPMVYYPIRTLVNAGIDEILIVTGGNSAGEFLRLLGNGKEFGLRHLNYTYQEGEGGIAAALSLAEYFCDNDKLVVILGDNIIEKNICSAVESFRTQGEGARILLKEVEDPERFGVAELRGKKVTGIEEKPRNPKSKYAATVADTRSLLSAVEARAASSAASRASDDWSSSARYSSSLPGKCWYRTGLLTPAASAMSSIAAAW